MFLKRHISVFKPEIVIMGLLPKEAFRSENPYTYCHGYIVDSKKIDQLYLVNGKIYSARTKNRFFGKLTAVMKHYYITPQFIQSRIKNLRKRFKKSQVQEENFNSPDYLQKKYALTFSLLKEYKEICLTHGARPVIVLIEGNPIEDNFIIQFTKAIGIPTLSLYPAFKELDDKQITYHFPRDLHWNTTGHKVAAETILDFLISLRII
jgi:hypothetical protein